MTRRNTPSSDSVLHLLKEAGVDADPSLIEAVGHIAELAERPAPEPSAELAQLMAGGGKAAGGRLTRGRITFIGGALAVSMGVGMSGVAAGPAERHEELDGSIDSVSRFWARDHVDRAPAASDAVPRGAASSSVDAAGSHSPDGAAQVPPTSDGGVPSSDGVPGADGSGFGVGPPPALPAAHPGTAPAPSPLTGVAAPSPLRQPAHRGVASAPGLPAPDVPAARTPDVDVPAPDTADAHRWDPRTSGSSIGGPERGAGISAGGPGDFGDFGGTAAPGVAELPKPADDMPRYVEEPVRFATLAWVNEGPDEPTSDAAPLVLLRAPGAAPDNVVFFSASRSGDGQWLALFVPDVTTPAGDPAAEEHVTWEPVTGEYVPWDPEFAPSAPSAPSAPGDAVPSPDAVPAKSREGTGDMFPGLEPSSGTLDGLRDGAVPSSESLPEGLPREAVGTAPKHGGSDAASAEEEPVGNLSGQRSPEDAPGAGEAAEAVPTGSAPIMSAPAEPVPVPDLPLSVEVPSGAAPAPGTPETSDELLPSASEVPVDASSGAPPAMEPYEDMPAG